MDEMQKKESFRNPFIRIWLAAALTALAAALLPCAAYRGAAARAADNKASMVKVIRTEGTVGISKSSGKDVPLIKNMQLYNGYQADTQEESYAWISLDDTKLSKLDAMSGASVRKQGKKLELLLESGNLFFNITEPLEDDEALTIRTSTTVIGIRGTCGWVEVVDGWRTQVWLLEGRVEIGVIDPVSGQEKRGTLSAGEMAACVVYGQTPMGGGRTV